ncbi:class I SAM-dependent methyltransferase, partial [bacterium]|nr:class I SAM-dependent methyltransferase [bacterium]
MSDTQDAYWSRDMQDRRRPDHPVVRAVYGPIAEMIASRVADPERSSILDVGCGNGFLQWSLEQRFGRVAGIDYSRRMLEVNPCREKHSGSCAALPFKNGSFDAVVAANLLHHLEESGRKRCLSEMKRVARRLVVSIEPNRNNPFMFAFSLVHKAERMGLSFTRAYMHELFGHAGLRNVQAQV